MPIPRLALILVPAAFLAAAVPLAVAATSPGADAPPVIAGAKGDRLPHTGTCSDEVWPYVSRSCLADPDAVGPARVVTIDGENATIIMR